MLPRLQIGLCALLAFAGCGEAPLEPRDPTPGAAHFRIMTYNIKVERSDDAETVLAVGASNADVLCLQEVSAAWESRLRDQYAERYPHMLFAPKENAGGLGILSRYPLTDRGVVQPPAGVHPGWIAEVAMPTFVLQIVNVHLRSLFNGEGDPASNFFETGDLHREEIQMFFERVNPTLPTVVLGFFERVNPTLPTVVLGDFNEGIGGAAVRWLEDRGYRNALHAFRPGQFTWSGPSVGQTYDLAIDHVMAGPEFDLLDASTARVGKSDHLPVTAHLQLRP